MLSFLREQGSEKLSTQKSNTAAGQTDSDAAKDAQAQGSSQEYLTVAAQNKNVRKSTMLVAVLFGIGLLSLWFMIKKSAPQTASASADGVQETQISTAIARLTGVSSEMFSRMDQIVNKFYEFSNVLQVQVNELVKNPFEVEFFLSRVKEKVDSQKNDIDIDSEIIRQERVRQKAKDLQLLTICQSEQGNCCMINDKILYEGDSIKEFGIAQIGDKFVKLEWREPKSERETSETQSQGIEIILKLSE
jgi:preprotein translocase subunit SecG